MFFRKRNRNLLGFAKIGLYMLFIYGKLICLVKIDIIMFGKYGNVSCFFKVSIFHHFP
jgi:hypothetical protein